MAYRDDDSDGLTAKEKIQYSLLGIILLGGAVIVGRTMVKKAQSNAEERKAYDDGSSASYAKLIKMAFENDGWFGTDEAALRNTLRRIPSKEQFRTVMLSYERLYNSSLLKDMKDELSTSEYSEMMAIVNGKPEMNQQPQLTSVQYQSWARRLKAAFDKTYGFIPGTDEEAIKAVFTEIPTQAAFSQVGVAYQSEFGNSLISDLKSELEFWEYQPMMNIIYRKP
jgi:hypothetical protein